MAGQVHGDGWVGQRNRAPQRPRWTAWFCLVVFSEKITFFFTRNIIWLVVWLSSILFSQKYWVSNHPNWRNHIFQRGSNHQPEKHVFDCLFHIWVLPFCLLKCFREPPRIPLSVCPYEPPWPHLGCFDMHTSSNMWLTCSNKIRDLEIRASSNYDHDQNCVSSWIYGFP